MNVVSDPADPRALGRIKGAAFREFVRWYQLNQAPAEVRRVVAALPPAIRSAMDVESEALGILASRWYEAEIVHALLGEVIRGKTKEERDELAKGGAKAVMDHTLRGIYRILFQWMATPRRYAKFGGKLWDSYYDSGEFSIEMPDASTAISAIRNWHSHHPFICDLNREAAFNIYAAMGCQGVGVQRTSCVAEGGDDCVFVTSWTSDHSHDE